VVEVSLSRRTRDGWERALEGSEEDKGAGVCCDVCCRGLVRRGLEERVAVPREDEEVRVAHAGGEKEGFGDVDMEDDITGSDGAGHDFGHGGAERV